MRVLVCININAWHAGREANPRLVHFCCNLLARLDLVQILNSALNATVCYVCIVWDVAN